MRKSENTSQEARDILKEVKMSVNYDELSMEELAELATKKGVAVNPLADSREDAIDKIKKARKPDSS